VRYMQIVEELTSAPDYEDALENLDKIVNSPAVSVKGGLLLKCKPCEGKTPALTEERIGELTAQFPGWQLIEEPKGGKIVKEFKFKDFGEAKYFLDLVCVIAEEQGHHPALSLIYNKLKITLTTHSAGGLTENDFTMAKIIDSIEG